MSARAKTWALLRALLAASTIGVLTPTAAAAGTNAVNAPATGTTPAAGTTTTPRASLPAIERRVMCVTCKIPLMVAESPQADRERAFIKGLIGEGETETQIEHALVGQYGPAVLGLPRAHGFDLTAYLVPLAAVLALIAALLVLLPRWRRRGRAQPTQDTAPLTAAQSARLDADLARFER